MRHTCIICKRKREEKFMQNVFGASWACCFIYHWVGGTCENHPDIERIKHIQSEIKKLEKVRFNNSFIPKL